MSQTPPEPNHRRLLSRADETPWRAIPGYRAMTPAEFDDHVWQDRASVTTTAELRAVLGRVVDDAFYEDLAAGVALSTMAMRLTPYVLSRIDWADPRGDPVRRQFLPLASEKTADHPLVGFDSTAEQADSPVPGLTHRYPDRALLLTTTVCPVYCRFCTRSYAVGTDTPVNEKLRLDPASSRLDAAFDYLAATPAIEDVIVSGGDCYRLNPETLRAIGGRLLDIEHVRRIRFATKGLAVLPMKITGHHAWREALVGLATDAKRRGKEVVVHTHVNHPAELSAASATALDMLYAQGVTVRNLAVVLAGVNDRAETFLELLRTLTWHNVRPHHAYLCDLVVGIDDMRTGLGATLELEKAVRGAISGPSMPSFVVDPPGGAGKRDAYSFESYDRDLGLAVYRSPAVKPGRLFHYLDPFHSLAPEVRAEWQVPGRARELLDGAYARAIAR